MLPQNKFFWTAVVTSSDKDWTETHLDKVLIEMAKFKYQGGTIFRGVEDGPVFPSYVRAVAEADMLVGEVRHCQAHAPGSCCDNSVLLCVDGGVAGEGEGGVVRDGEGETVACIY